jgi:hypothetical protein
VASSGSAPDRLLEDIDLRDGDVLEAEIAPLPRLGGDRGDARAVDCGGAACEAIDGEELVLDSVRFGYCGSK